MAKTSPVGPEGPDADVALVPGSPTVFAYLNLIRCPRAREAPLRSPERQAAEI